MWACSEASWSSTTYQAWDQSLREHVEKMTGTKRLCISENGQNPKEGGEGSLLTCLMRLMRMFWGVIPTIISHKLEVEEDDKEQMVKQEEMEVDHRARKVELGGQMTPEPIGLKCPTNPRRTINTCTSQGHWPLTNYSSVSQHSQINSNCLSSYQAPCRQHKISHLTHSRSEVISGKSCQISCDSCSISTNFRIQIQTSFTSPPVLNILNKMWNPNHLAY